MKFIRVARCGLDHAGGKLVVEVIVGEMSSAGLKLPILIASRRIQVAIIQILLGFPQSAAMCIALAVYATDVIGSLVASLTVARSGV